MERFYGNSINDINTEFLLKATPFTKDTRINFSFKLTEECFFENFYADSNLKIEKMNNENIYFNQQVLNHLKCVKNSYSKVDLIHISGYGGCGKTTYVRHIIWELKQSFDIEQIIYDFEGEKHIIDAIEIELAKKLFKYYQNNCNFQSLYEFVMFLDIRRFSECKTEIYSVFKELSELSSADKKKISHKYFSDLFRKILNKPNNNGYLYFLLTFDFLLELTLRIIGNIKTPLVILFDNVDSISDLSEEKSLLLVMKNFINDCNYFFCNNLLNESNFNSVYIKDLIIDYKVIFFLTTRIVTIKKYLELEPDLERIYGWVSLEMPENFYDHKEIISKKINFYLKTENKDSDKIKELCFYGNMFDIIYKNYIYKQIFNGNIRFCIDSLCKIIDLYKKTMVMNDLQRIHFISIVNNDRLNTHAGINGIIISIIMNYFKRNDIYENKLHLSECLPNGEISLSRILLTVLKEKGGSCSFYDILSILSPYFNVEDICKNIYDLSESDRDVWRRLVTFSEVYPKTFSDFLLQGQKFENGVNDITEYSMINLCKAGITYMDNIVPHFEFMLSRHRNKYKIEDKNYQPLFSSSSFDRIDSSKYRYRFERKINYVYSDVKDCCSNSIAFAKKVMLKTDYDEKKYVNNSYFTYHTTNADGSSGYKQSYESRLIFSHIGYVERFRRYAMQNNFNGNKEEINKILIECIKKYINLYFDNQYCLQTKRQNEVANYLMMQIRIIEKSDYKAQNIVIEII